MARTSVTDCDLTEVVFAGAHIERIEVVSTVAANLDLDGAKLVRSRFVGCNLYGLKARRVGDHQVLVHEPAGQHASRS